ncbi:MAG: hypothetical protein WKG06_36640 [Segetibacter sp.]
MNIEQSGNNKSTALTDQYGSFTISADNDNATPAVLLISVIKAANHKFSRHKGT